MCGIAGLINWPETNLESARRAMEAMAGAMHHRGPDDQAAVAFPEVGAVLGATRLAIVDVEHGRQPAANESRRVWAVLNGEIYNHAGLRAELESRGHRFRSRSDTEVLAHLYEEQGEAMFEALEGMYAAAVVDLASGTVLLGRDHAGMKPLFYAERGSGLAFASDIRALLAARLVAPEADWTELANYFVYGYLPAPGCAFRGIRKLLPGCYLRWRAGNSLVARHWRPPEETAAFDPDASRALEHLLKEAARTHLQGDVEVGCFLSGGWDSSIIATMAAEQVSRLRTFALVLPESPEVDEARHARAVAGAIGAVHEEVEYRQAMLPELLEEAAWQLEEPSSATPYVLIGLLAKAAARRVKAVIGGEGSDELFAGYPWLARKAPYLLHRWVPSWLARLLMPLAPDARWRRLLRQIAAENLEDLDFELVRRTNAAALPAIGPLARRPVRGADAYAMVERQVGVRPSAHHGDRLPQRLLLEYGGRLTGAILYCSDRMTMAHSLEFRMPFLDRGVVEFAMRLPSRWKLHRGQGKAILKPIAARLTPAVAHRRKLGLHIPDSSLQSPAMREFVFRLLLDSGSLFPAHQMEPALNRLFNGPARELRSVGQLVRLQLWWNAFLAPGRSRTPPACPVAWLPSA